MMNDTDVLNALRTVLEPETGYDIVRLGWVRELKVGQGSIQFTLLVPDPTIGFAKHVVSASETALTTAFGDGINIQVQKDGEMIDLGADLKIDGKNSQAGPGGGVLNIVAIASGKGGVGKSTVSCNLAVALSNAGYRVGLADLDIYGPSIPTMFGLEDAKPKVNEARRMVPLEKYGVKLLSMGFLVEPDKAMIWRGPMVTSAVRQFLSETEWGALDYLILDLPPGTGDIQLTIVQTIPLNGALIVSTPQRVALADARRGVGMFDQVQVPVLGIVENMSYFTPPDMPDRKYYLFGEGGAKALASELSVPFLGEVPLEQVIRENGDAGTPVVTDPSTAASKVFSDLASRLVSEIEHRNACRPATRKIDILHR